MHVITYLCCLQELADVQYKDFDEKQLPHVDPVASQHTSAGWYYNGKLSC